ncbi:hypothetical protein HJ588_15570 [Flexivirga sp. ID2601S]|uniref:Prepilin type IV endopeptidase peptidase domain-containing protein n=1 Tax=Flexivirga aerilata TaxID=1656889 RepID=A0A849AIN9_9MICO|nr:MULTISPECIES: prepilin peptidase [Flexivirga]NNG40684.1 hypothetical protein [Flexivirga aerilata]
MDTAGFTVAAALVGALTGVLSVRNLRTLRYRYDHEAVLPQPSSAAWVLPTAVIAATALGLRLSPDRPWALLLLAPLAVTGPWLAAVDLDVHRLPDRVLGPVAVASLIAVVVVSATTHRLQVPVLGGVGLVLAGGCYLTLHLVGGGAVGLGDVKLAAVLGLALGAVGLGVLWWAMLLSSLLCLAWVAVTRRGKPSSTRIAFGPWMLLGSLIAVAVFAP